MSWRASECVYDSNNNHNSSTTRTSTTASPYTRIACAITAISLDRAGGVSIAERAKVAVGRSSARAGPPRRSARASPPRPRARRLAPQVLAVPPSAVASSGLACRRADGRASAASSAARASLDAAPACARRRRSSPIVLFAPVQAHARAKGRARCSRAGMSNEAAPAACARRVSVQR